MSTNKPTLPGPYVDVNNRNLGNSPATPSGIFAFTGAATDGTTTTSTIASIGGPNEVASKIGKGELADKLLDFFANGGKKAYAVPLLITTESTIGSAGYTRINAGTTPSTGTIAAAKTSAKLVPNKFSILIEVTKTGGAGVGKWKISTDGGTNYGPVVLMAATYEIPTTNITLTLTGSLDDGDLITVAASAPATTAALALAAVQALIASDYDFDAVVNVVASDATAVGNIKTELEAAPASPNFRYTYAMVCPALSTSIANSLLCTASIMASISSDRIQVISAEAAVSRLNHGDQADANCIGILAGRRSSLALQNDLGLVAAGTLNNIVDFPSTVPNITAADKSAIQTYIEDLDAMHVVSIRKFKGLAGFFPTNGPMTDPYSDVEIDAFRLVLDKAARIARITALGFHKIDVDPTDVIGSTLQLKNAIQGAIDSRMTGNGEIVQAAVAIPDGQDIITTKEILVDISVIPFGHADWIGIRIGLTASIPTT
jgi:hypothetical protein